jgi:hypothetical protein
VQALVEREILLERRQAQSEPESLWDNLSLAQKFAASSLTQFGYDLAYIRSSQQGNVAILLRDGVVATIADDGEIDTSPTIKVRN